MVQPAITTHVHDVLSEYAKLTKRHTGYTGTPEATRAAVSFLRWCRDNEVEQPLLFMWLRFRILRSGRRNALAHPSLQNMASMAILPKYRDLNANSQGEQQMRSHFVGQYERTLLANSVGAEAVRRDYVINGRTDMCEVQPRLSESYHPFSQWCPQCPRAQSCAERLNKREGFDVVALRLGKLSPEQAAQARRQHRVDHTSGAVVPRRE